MKEVIPNITGHIIKKKLGEGGMGVVWLGENIITKRKVAIKILRKENLQDETLKKRFLMEAKVMSKLNHPGIVDLYDILPDEENGHYIIMEYAPGKMLADHIKKVSGPIVESKLVPLFSQILDAIGHAHDKKVIHRDIKPANIIITKNNEVKIVDFGIAKRQNQNAQQSLDTLRTQIGTQMGTVLYMSPEAVTPSFGKTTK